MHITVIGNSRKGTDMNKQIYSWIFAAVMEKGDAA